MMAERTPKHSMNRWQVGIILLVGLFLGALLLTVALAFRRVSPVVAPDYYQRGLHYDRERVRETQGERLGWRLSTEQHGPLLRLRLQDGAGRPVTGGEGEFFVETLAGLTAGAGSLPLAEEGGGWYGVRLPPAAAAGARGRVTIGTTDASISRRVAVLP